MADSIRKLAREVADLTKLVKGASRTPQLAFSSIENGSIDEYDADGNLVAVYGQQYDGSHGAVPVTGPAPPPPSTPIVLPAPGQLTVQWDGYFSNGDGEPDPLLVAPLDFTRIEVHASTDPDFDPVFAETLRATIETPRGADVVLAPLEPVTYYVKFITRTTPGRASLSSPTGVGTPLQPVLAEVDDGQPPPVPSAPTVDDSRALLSVGWDGLGAAGEAMPADFRQITVERAPAATGPWLPFDALVSAGTVFPRPVEYDVETWFRLVSEDKWGNKSEPSAVVSGTSKQLVDSDVILSEIDAAKTIIRNAGQMGLTDGKTLDQSITDAANSLVTKDRMPEGGMPADFLADLSLTVRKFNTNRHQIY